MTTTLTDTIIVHINGRPLAVPAGCSLQEALTLPAAGMQPDGPGVIATALNGQHIARGTRGQTVLSSGDQITTFEPITGG
jgi:sulfur carrier protein ThiS